MDGREERENLVLFKCPRRDKKTHPVSFVISTMSAMAVSGARHDAPSTAAAPTTTKVDLSATPRGERLDTMSPTRAPRNNEGANRPPTRPPPTQTFKRVDCAKKGSGKKGISWRSHYYC